MSRIGKIARRTFLFGAVAVTGGAAFGYYEGRYVCIVIDCFLGDTSRCGQSKHD